MADDIRFPTGDYSMRRSFLALLFPILALFACGGGKPAKPVERSGFLRDTHVRVTVFDASVPADSVQRAIDRCLAEMAALEGLTTAHADTSAISRINGRAGREPVAVPPEIGELLRKAAALSVETEGAFDFTLGALKRLWGFDSEHPAVPDSASVRALLAAAGPEKLVLGEGTAFLADRGAAIDLGGLGEGLLIDRGVRVLRQAGVKAGIVETSGELRTFGRKPGRKPWRIGVRHPRDPGGGLIGILSLGEAGVSTSGDYERFFMENGKRYCHILDPATGYPARRCISATIVAADALTADAFDTAVFVLGPEKGMALIEKLPGIEGIIMTEKDGRITQLVSSGLKSRYQPND
jgi:FAD:protein FMN transferase